MKVKINTKERFHAITLPGPVISATMTEELCSCLLPYLQNDVKNVVLILKDIEMIDDAAGQALVNIQQKFYECNASLVLCELQKPVLALVQGSETLDVLNVTPTESEAWDMVQMEEIEREFLAGDQLE